MCRALDGYKELGTGTPVHIPAYPLSNVQRDAGTKPGLLEGRSETRLMATDGRRQFAISGNDEVRTNDPTKEKPWTLREQAYAPCSIWATRATWPGSVTAGDGRSRT